MTGVLNDSTNLCNTKTYSTRIKTNSVYIYDTDYRCNDTWHEPDIYDTKALIQGSCPKFFENRSRNNKTAVTLGRKYLGTNLTYMTPELSFKIHVQNSSKTVAEITKLTSPPSILKNSKENPTNSAAATFNTIFVTETTCIEDNPPRSFQRVEQNSDMLSTFPDINRTYHFTSS